MNSVTFLRSRSPVPVMIGNLRLKNGGFDICGQIHNDLISDLASLDLESGNLSYKLSGLEKYIF